MNKKLIIKCIVIAGLTLLVAGLSVSAYRLIVPNRHVGFTTYKPSKLPPGTNVERVAVLAWKPLGLLHLYQYELVSSLSSRITITQKRTTEAFHPCQTAIANVDCTNHVTPSGQPYVEEVATQPNGTPFSETIAWTKGSTYIWITTNGPTIQTDTTWGEVIDSFKPYRYVNLPVITGHQGP